VNCELDYRDTKSGERAAHDPDGRCCVIGLLHIARATFAATGGTGKCSVCGASFIYGDVWVHEPSGEHIHVGHDCASKYSLMTDRSAWELANDRMRAAMALQIEKARKTKERAAFLAAHPGLEEALRVDHRVINDIAERFRASCFISGKTVALVRKIALEASRPKVEERLVPTPEGKALVRGKLVGFKSRGGYSTKVEYKMTVKVTTPDGGTWLAWGTCQAAFLDRPGGARSLIGLDVQFNATLKRGREPHFALFSRPTKAEVVQNAAYMRRGAHLRLAAA
jgi:hypothetical protein